MLTLARRGTRSACFVDYRDAFGYLREKLGDERIITARPFDNLGTGTDVDVWVYAPVELNWAGWVGDEETTTIYRAFVEIHYALIPYLMKHGASAFDQGTSLTNYLTKEDYTYLLGPDVFVAPMLEAGTSRTLTFPEGSWVYLFDDSKKFGGLTEASLDIPMNEFPAFVREGSEIAETPLAGR